MAVASVAVMLLALVNLAPATAESSDYCRDQGAADPRCDPRYCEDPANQQDPYCADPTYCEWAIDDPICRKDGEPEPKKQTCVWYVDGAPVGSVVPVLRQSNPGPHVVRLDCPNHQLKDWVCREKGRDGTPIPETGMKEPVCTYHGATTTPTSCAATFVWTVMVPDFNTWTVELSATTYKVKEVKETLPTGQSVVACVGPVDWNTSKVVQDPDGTLGVFCVLENEFLAKDTLFKSGGQWHHYRWNDDGTADYHTHPNVASMPDGKIDECDLQKYSIQWRQWN